MLMLSVGKGRQVIKQLCRRVLQYYATVATECAGYVLYRALLFLMSKPYFECCQTSSSVLMVGGNSFINESEEKAWFS